MDELVAWCRQQLDDDRRAAIHMTRWDDDFLKAIRDPDVRRYVNQVADPETVLADVAAKRAILGAHSHEHECIELTGSGEHSVVDGKPWELWEPRPTADYGPCFVLRTLASAYRHRPGWKTEWEA